MKKNLSIITYLRDQNFSISNGDIGSGSGQSLQVINVNFISTKKTGSPVAPEYVVPIQDIKVRDYNGTSWKIRKFAEQENTSGMYQ